MKHISCYALDNPTCEVGFIKNLEAPEKTAAQMYEYALDYLPQNGFKQYEISNFSVPGYACRHNLNYWDNGPYTGLGPSAFSYIEGKRAENVPDIRGYIKNASCGKPAVSFSERLDRAPSAKETAAVKVRTAEGISFKWFKGKTGYDFLHLEEKALPRLFEDRLVEYIKDSDTRTGIRLTKKGILFCDIVSAAFL